MKTRSPPPVQFESFLLQKTLLNDIQITFSTKKKLINSNLFLETLFFFPTFLVNVKHFS